MHLLLVEDDARLRFTLTRLLEHDRHLVEAVATGRDGLALASVSDGYDALVLDLNLPDVSGLDVCRRLRREGSGLPILMLTARDGVDDRVAGLDAGADDYLVKPFAYGELAARLRALGRRRGPPADVGVLRAGSIALDERAREVRVEGTPVPLSPREFALLECLLRNRGRVLSRDQLLDLAWPVGVGVTPNSVDAYVHFLRRKLGDAGERIETVRGFGYRLAAH